MNKKIFLVFGYGIPKDMLKDENYNFYLKSVFNKIYDISSKNINSSVSIIFCGGNTDLFAPYKRTEADEMIGFFDNIIKQKMVISGITNKWKFVSENDSLSTLENLVNSKKLINGKRISDYELFIFCEQTRERRIKIISKKVFTNVSKIKVVPVDFDVSNNRYLPLDFLAKKEKAEIKYSIKALSSSVDFKKHHEIFVEKFDYLRKMGAGTDPDKLRIWWEGKLKEFDEDNKNKNSL